MSSTNLTRLEAADRAALLTIDKYFIDLDVTGDDQTFSSTTTVFFEAKEEGDTFIDLRAARVESVLLDDEDITATAVGDTYDEDKGIQLHLTPGAHELRVSAQCLYSRTGQGLHRFVDPADGEVYMYTQFETADAKRVFACFDQPDLKASYAMRVRTPANWRVISNPEMHVSEDGTVHEGETGYRVSTYLVAFCIGPYHEVRSSWTGTLTHHPETPEGEPTELTVPFGIYCRKSVAHALDADVIFEQTRQGFDYYHKHFGMAYPFGKYDQVFCPEYNMGAMENSGCVTFRDEYVFTEPAAPHMYERRCETILHELAHMWFGDLVTMRWWDDLWLNESFATWASVMAQSENTEYVNEWVTFSMAEKSHAYQQDQLPSTHPILADATDIRTVEQNFDGITYSKGASVLKQLFAYVGRDAFFKAIRMHFARHAWGNATFDDLLGALEEASGRDLSAWADQWLKTTGISDISADFTVENGVYTKFDLVQGGPVMRDHRLAVGLYNIEGDKVVRVMRVETDLHGERSEVAGLVGAAEADIVLVNDNDLTYCMAGMDEKSLANVIANIDKIEDPMVRSLCWSTAWQRTRAGLMPARDFLELVVRGLASETEHFVLNTVLLSAKTASLNYSPTPSEMFADEIVNRIKAGDKVLRYQQLLCTLPVTEKSAPLILDMRNGADQSLRWQALVCLIANGRVANPAEEIAAELARDKSSGGQKWAWVAEGAAHRVEVFRDLLDNGDKKSNLELRHKAMGVTWAPVPEELKQEAPYFFDSAASVWDRFESEVAQRTLHELYPYWAPEVKLPEISGFDPALQRILIEGQHTMERIRKCRAL
ncbi:MAG: aminopeptidase N [Corynebacterium sp.]|nr:aminopeptidase N [Corynebacterium sp.]